jgi:hypothetical protein
MYCNAQKLRNTHTHFAPNPHDLWICQLMDFNYIICASIHWHLPLLKIGKYVSCRGFFFFFIGYYAALLSLSLFVFNFQPASQLTRVRILGEHRFIICCRYEHRRSIVQVRVTMNPTLLFFSYLPLMFSCSLHNAACCLFLLSCNIKGVSFILFLNTAALSHRKPSSAGTSCDSYRFQTGTVRT